MIDLIGSINIGNLIITTADAFYKDCIKNLDEFIVIIDEYHEVIYRSGYEVV